MSVTGTPSNPPTRASWSVRAVAADLGARERYAVNASCAAGTRPPPEDADVTLADIAPRASAGR